MKRKSINILRTNHVFDQTKKFIQHAKMDFFLAKHFLAEDLMLMEKRFFYSYKPFPVLSPN